MAEYISRDRLKELMFSGKSFRLVDVLDEEYFEKERIKGSISLPLEEIERNAAKILKKDELIVVYCASFRCLASTKAAEKLVSMGYKNVLDYKGGLQDYREGNLPLEGSLHPVTKNLCNGVHEGAVHAASGCSMC